MFHTRELNNWINGLRERALRITYQNRISSFDKLLTIDKSAFIHHKNVHYLLIETYKVKMSLASPIMKDIIATSESKYSLKFLRSGITMTRSNIRTNEFGSETVSMIR